VPMFFEYFRGKILRESSRQSFVSSKAGLSRSAASTWGAGDKGEAQVITCSGTRELQLLLELAHVSSLSSMGTRKRRARRAADSAGVMAMAPNSA